MIFFEFKYAWPVIWGQPGVSRFARSESTELMRKTSLCECWGFAANFTTSGTEKALDGARKLGGLVVIVGSILRSPHHWEKPLRSILLWICFSFVKDNELFLVSIDLDEMMFLPCFGRSYDYQGCDPLWKVGTFSLHQYRFAKCPYDPEWASTTARHILPKQRVKGVLVSPLSKEQIELYWTFEGLRVDPAKDRILQPPPRTLPLWPGLQIFRAVNPMWVQTTREPTRTNQTGAAGGCLWSEVFEVCIAVKTYAGTRMYVAIRTSKTCDHRGHVDSPKAHDCFEVLRIMCICALGCQATKAVFDVCLCKLAHQAAGHFRPSWTNSWVPLKKGTALWPLRQADATSNKWHRY